MGVAMVLNVGKRAILLRPDSCWRLIATHNALAHVLADRWKWLTLRSYRAVYVYLNRVPNRAVAELKSGPNPSLAVFWL